VADQQVQIVVWERQDAWDDYVASQSGANIYQQFGWKRVIEASYGRKAFYLAAVRKPERHVGDEEIIGVLPLICLKHFLFGKSLISMPYFDMGGVLSNDEQTTKSLINTAIELGKRLKVDAVEIRQNEPAQYSDIQDDVAFKTQTNKVRMLLELPETSDKLMKSFKSKLRSQIRKPTKAGLTSRIGGLELLDDFYRVFSINMRDLGSPVHAKRFIENVLREFAETGKIVIVYSDNTPVAASVVVGFRDILENPWASSLKNYSRLSPNMLLYWIMLEYACDTGYNWFDFGRSAPDEGTYKFKKQWGAKPAPLYWHHIYLNGQPSDTESSGKSKFDSAIRQWKKLPVSMTRFIGPMIRRHIGL
jgi:FemAB-related protein (PEP-CTERM system-associated)